MPNPGNLISSRTILSLLCLGLGPSFPFVDGRLITECHKVKFEPWRPLSSLGLSGVVPISLKNSSAVEGTHYATQLQ